MSQYSSESMDELKESISKIGEKTPEFTFKSKKIIENLKKCKGELLQQSYNDAFNIGDENI